MAKRTRKETEHQLIRQPCDLHCNVLPTPGDDKSSIRKLKEDDETEGVVNSTRFADNQKAVKEAASRVYQVCEMSVGDRTKIPTVNMKTIVTRCQRVYEKGVALTQTAKRHGESHPEVVKYRGNLGPLFDICSCSCLRYWVDVIKLFNIIS